MYNNDRSHSAFIITASGGFTLHPHFHADKADTRERETPTQRERERERERESVEEKDHRCRYI